MNKLFITIAFCLLSINLLSQGLIGTPTSLVIVYNYPENYFYVSLDGKDKRKTVQENVFIIDNKLVQVRALNKSKFLSDELKSQSQKDILLEYIKWESDYIQNTFNFNINSKIETLVTKTGKEVIFWTYDMPIGEPIVKTDSTITTPTQKQMFILTMVKDYVFGINTPLFESDQFESNKQYLLDNIDHIVVEDKEINLEELYKKLSQ
ncbi:MAG TPA: hypothetical protein PK081_00800 [Bacteroidales bacterium]|nr:hypothetical protein [Bacteroidales bacterium]